MNGNGKAAEWPKIQGNYKGGFQYGYQFPEGSHASVPAAGVSVSPGSFYLCVNRCRYNVYYFSSPSPIKKKNVYTLLRI